MKKAECELAIRHFCGVWARERGLPHRPTNPDFGDFYRWLEATSPGHLKFRSVMPVRDEVERWFAQEFGQTWRY